jgi:cytochrome d ubiquinol oxidase subunit II
MIRGLSIELRKHLDHPLWAQFWDAMFFLGSALLAVFYGVALGNVVRGVPINSDGNFFQPLWTNFNPVGDNPGILDPYTILIGVLALATLIVHGASWVALKTEGELNARCRRIALWAWIALIALTALGTAATFLVSPEMLGAFLSRPYGLALPLVAIAGLVAFGVFNRAGHDRNAFLASGTFIVGMMTSTVFGVYPDVLPAVDPANSLTVQNAASSQYSQTVGLVWWSIGMVLAAVYFTVIYRLFRGKVSLEEEGY